jgi:hypothetical protein
VKMVGVGAGAGSSAAGGGGGSGSGGATGSSLTGVEAKNDCTTPPLNPGEGGAGGFVAGKLETREDVSFASKPKIELEFAAAGAGSLRTWNVLGPSRSGITTTASTGNASEPITSATQGAQRQRTNCAITARGGI